MASAASQGDGSSDAEGQQQRRLSPKEAANIAASWATALDALARVGSRHHQLIGSCMARFHEQIAHSHVVDVERVVRSLGQLGYAIFDEQATPLFTKAFHRNQTLEKRLPLLRYAMTVNVSKARALVQQETTNFLEKGKIGKLGAEASANLLYLLCSQ